MRELWDSLKESLQELGGVIKEIVMGKDDTERDASFGIERDIMKAGNTGFSITSGKYLSKSDSLMHYLVVAGSGAGKTVNTIIPGILHQKNASMIVPDNSGEIYTKTAEAKTRDGYTILNLDFGVDVFTNDSSFFNPLARINKNDKSGISKVVKLLVGKSEGKDQYWNAKSEEVLNLAIAIILSEPEEKQTLHNVLRCLEFMASDQDDMSKHIVQMDENTFHKWKLLLSNSQNTLDSIRSSAIATLSWLGHNDNLIKLTSQDSINFNDLRNNKIVLYIRIPITSDFCTPLLNIFFSQFFQYFLSQSVPKEADRLIMIFGDEFGSLHIPQFPKILSNCRKFLISTQMVVQSEYQLEEAYSLSGKKIILANCSKLFLQGIDEEADVISKKLGTKTIKDEKTGYTKEVPLMTPFELRTMQGKGIFFPKGARKPILVTLKPYYKVPCLLRLSQLEPVSKKSLKPIHVFTPLFTLK